MHWLIETWLYIRSLYWTFFLIFGIIMIGVVAYIIIKEVRKQNHDLF